MHHGHHHHHSLHHSLHRVKVNMYSPELELIAEFVAEFSFAKNLPNKIKLAELTAEFFSTKNRARNRIFESYTKISTITIKLGRGTRC